MWSSFLFFGFGFGSVEVFCFFVFRCFWGAATVANPAVEVVGACGGLAAFESSGCAEVEVDAEGIISTLGPGSLTFDSSKAGINYMLGSTGFLFLFLFLFLSASFNFLLVRPRQSLQR